MPEHVLDTVVLRSLAFAHPDGHEILLTALDARQVWVPAEVYARDEGVLPLDADDDILSEFARGLRYAQRQVRISPPRPAGRFQLWLDNARQVSGHASAGRLLIQHLQLEELPLRESFSALWHRAGRSGMPGSGGTPRGEHHRPLIRSDRLQSRGRPRRALADPPRRPRSLGRAQGASGRGVERCDRRAPVGAVRPGPAIHRPSSRARASEECRVARGEPGAPRSPRQAS